MNDDTLDMATLARFAILPGAGTLMRAFSEIPPGPLRDSVIQHAQVIAATYTGAPAQHRMPDPIGAITPRQPARLAIATRTGREPPGGDRDTEAVKMRMAGATVPEIVQALGITKQRAYQAFYNARKAGITLPGKKDRPLPGSSIVKSWHTDASAVYGQGLAAIERAAAERGISPQAYLDRRSLALKLAMEGRSYETILAATGETNQKVVSSWLSNARAAGFSVPYVVYFETVAAPPEPVSPPPEPQASPGLAKPWVFPDVDDIPPPALSAIVAAAKSRNMTVHAYQEMRNVIVFHRLDGKTTREIMALTGESDQSVRDTISSARARGVIFPDRATEAIDPPQLAAQALKDAG